MEECVPRPGTTPQLIRLVEGFLTVPSAPPETKGTVGKLILSGSGALYLSLSCRAFAQNAIRSRDVATLEVRALRLPYFTPCS